MIDPSLIERLRAAADAADDGSAPVDTAAFLYEVVDCLEQMQGEIEEARTHAHLSILNHAQDEMPTVLLQSIHKTHADVLSFDHVSEDYRLGIRTAVGDFTHTPSGRRYIVAVAPIPPEA